MALQNALKHRTTFGTVSGEVVGAAACCALVAVSSVAVAILGVSSLLIPAYVGALVLAVWSPSKAALGALVVGITFEPGAIDISHPISVAIYQMPPGFDHTIPITMTPLELLTCVIAVSIVVRPRRLRSTDRLPVLVWAVPAVIAVSFVYGVTHGGDIKIGYEEARGLLFALVAFVVARRLAQDHTGGTQIATLVGTTGLGVVVLVRYFFVTRDGTSGVPPEFSYAHEDAIFLAAGFVLAGALLLANAQSRARAFLLIHELLILSALFATGRRSGTLALIVGVAALTWFSFRRRPRLIIAFGLPALLLGGAYLGAYWNKQYGALAQPARAVRSQIDPTARDQSSDAYRDTERYDVIQTIRFNRPFGVGLGRPFGEFQPLPSLTSFWPLQLYTPHANLLWLWLKFGLVGAAVIIATWVIALQRCITSVRRGMEELVLPVAPTVCACVLVMYFAYAQVDLALIGSRSASVLAIVIAIALSFRDPARGRHS